MNATTYYDLSTWTYSVIDEDLSSVLEVTRERGSNFIPPAKTETKISRIRRVFLPILGEEPGGIKFQRVGVDSGIM